MATDKQQRIQIIAVLIALFYIVSQFNAMVSLRNNIKRKEIEISEAYQYRIDSLNRTFFQIDNDYRVETIEEEISDALTALQKAVNFGNVKQMSLYNKELVKLFAELMRVLETIPEFQTKKEEFSNQILKTQDAILVSYNGYNEAVQQYNDRVTQYPGFIYARLFGFKPYEYVTEWS